MPPSDSRSVVPTAVLSPLGLAGLAESLRAAGFEAEIYDAMATSLGAQSIRLHMEHSYPQVVAAAAHGSTSEAARDVLRVAKEVIPGVFTVLLGAVAKVLADEGIMLENSCIVGKKAEHQPHEKPLQVMPCGKPMWGRPLGTGPRVEMS